LRKLLPRTFYHELMYYSLPRVFRWGEDDHYFMDASNEKQQRRLNPGSETNLLPYLDH